MEPQLPNTITYPDKPFKSHFIEFIETLAVFLAIALFVYYIIAQPHKVSGSSMFPNFRDGDYIITNKIIYKIESPTRGQVIVFKNPRDNAQDFIKRIIGLPGDRVKIIDGRIFINNTLLKETYLNSTVFTSGGLFLPEGEEITVPSDHYFVLGDNRNASSDSREWGYISKGDIIGEAYFRYWPQDEIGLIQQAKYKF